MTDRKAVRAPGLHPLHRLIFTALIREGAAGEEAFREWLRTVDFEALDYTSFRMVPLLFERFRHLRHENPHYHRMKGIRQYFYYRNTLILRAAGDYAGALASAGITPLFFKGLGCVLKYYENPGLRPLGDVDILVRSADFSKAERILENMGYSPLHDESTRRHIPHSTDFLNSSGIGIDLHSAALAEDARHRSDDRLFIRAVRDRFGDADILSACPEDLLLTACVGGVREITETFTIQNAQWILDLHHILQKCPDFDWGRVQEEARRRRVAPQLYIALAAAKGLFPDTVPDHVLAALYNARLLKKALTAANYRAGQPDPLGPTPFDIRLKWALHSRREIGRPLPFRLVTFPSFIVSNFHLKHPGELPIFVARALKRRLLSRTRVFKKEIDRNV